MIQLHAWTGLSTGQQHLEDALEMGLKLWQGPLASRQLAIQSTEQHLEHSLLGQASHFVSLPLGLTPGWKAA